MLKSNMFLASILEGFGPRFGRIFGRFFGPKTHAKCKNMILAKTSKIIDFPKENCIFSRIRRCKKRRKPSKNQGKIACYLGVRFWMHFEWILGGFGEAKIINFRTFSHVFWKQISNNVLEAKKIEKNGPTRAKAPHFKPARRNARLAGERKREGGEALRCRRYRKQAVD